MFLEVRLGGWLGGYMGQGKTDSSWCESNLVLPRVSAIEILLSLKPVIIR